MKNKILIAAILLSAFAWKASAQFDPYSQDQLIQLLIPTNTAASTITGPIVDMNGCVGVASVVCSYTAVAGTNETISATLQDSKDGTNFANVAIGAASTINSYSITNIPNGAFINVQTNWTPGTAFTSTVTFATAATSLTQEFGIPVRDTRRYWRFTLTCAGTNSTGTMSIVAKARNTTAN